MLPENAKSVRPPIVIVGTASNSPRNSAPASPMMIFAGFQLNGRKPKQMPTAMIAISGAMFEPSNRPASNNWSAKRNNAPPAIATMPAASPSSPSMRLIAFVIKHDPQRGDERRPVRRQRDDVGAEEVERHPEVEHRDAEQREQAGRDHLARDLGRW